MRRKRKKGKEEEEEKESKSSMKIRKDLFSITTQINLLLVTQI